MFTNDVVIAVERDFTSAMPRLEGRREALFSVFTDASADELICLKYIYAYMPLSDAASYDGELFLALVRDALEARRSFPWGETIPDLIFLNYVLAVRVNNEDLTDHRNLFREEMETRLRGLSMEEAALEVNVWCYEKATYQSTDSRTVSPLTIIRRGFGRCGEESTFTVSALRSVGLPARQCYAPRWSHSDDNHAWVEVWIDGNWHYMGACEPEAALDKGWFSSPARRALLIETRVFSGLVEDEEVIRRGRGMTLINVSENYFPTVKLLVQVLRDDLPLPGATVDFSVVNYAQFTPVVCLETDEDGRCSVNLGLGDVYLRVRKGAYYLEHKISLGEDDVELVLDFTQAKMHEVSDFDLVMRAPVAVTIEEPKVTPEAAKRMAAKRATAERILAAYIGSFADAPPKAEGEEEDDALREQRHLADSLGNQAEIRRFLDETDSGLRKQLKLDLLDALLYKDLSDSTAELLLHHALAAAPYADSYPADVYRPFLLNPRIGMEMLSAWRGIGDRVKEENIRCFKADPSAIYYFVEDLLEDAGEYDYDTLIADPEGAWDLGYASIQSRHILTLALSRSIGIPARINALDYRLEYYQDGEWKHYLRLGEEAAVPKRGKLSLQKTDAEESIVYGTNWTLTRMGGETSQEALGYYGIDFNEAGSLTLELDEGYYQLLVCDRLASGDILAEVTRFHLPADETVTRDIRIPRDLDGEIELPAFCPLALVGEVYTGAVENGLLAVLEPGTEPCEHFFNELLENEAQVETWQEQVTFVLRDRSALENAKLGLILDRFPKIRVAYPEEDLDGYTLLSFDSYSLHNRQWPLLVLTSGEAEVKLAISGYQVGSVAQLIRHMR